MPLSSNNKSRPVYLNLLRIRQPVGAVVSIIHRISGLLLALALPALFYLFQQSLQSEEGYQEVRQLFGGILGQVALLAIVWLSVEHLLSGLRHLFLDVDVGISRRAARRSAWLVLAGSVIITVLLAGGGRGG
jgi:succinate dehydrogenase / fumarate reductase cytochrome b subunit